mgnify:CR=1 FL=1
MNLYFEILPLDYLVLTIVILFIIFSAWKGLINSILALLTWVGSILITVFSYNYLSDYINNILLNISFLSNFVQFNYVLSMIISIPLIFLLSLFVLKRIRKILSSDLDRQILGLLIDKFFGAIYGILFSYIIFSTILYSTNKSEILPLKNINIFLKEKSNILKEIDDYNQNFFGNYFKEDLDN